MTFEFLPDPGSDDYNSLIKIVLSDETQVGLCIVSILTYVISSKTVLSSVTYYLIEKDCS